MVIEGRLKKLAERLRAADEELQISAEQLAFLSAVADEARVNMLVSESPLDQREFKERQGDLDRHRRLHEKLLSEIAALRAEQDRLLDGLVE